MTFNGIKSLSVQLGILFEIIASVLIHRIACLFPNGTHF